MNIDDLYPFMILIYSFQNYIFQLVCLFPFLIGDNIIAFEYLQLKKHGTGQKTNAKRMVENLPALVIKKRETC